MSQSKGNVCFYFNPEPIELPFGVMQRGDRNDRVIRAVDQKDGRGGVSPMRTALRLTQTSPSPSRLRP